jgi:hypothetical protein
MPISLNTKQIFCYIETSSRCYKNALYETRLIIIMAVQRTEHMYHIIYSVIMYGLNDWVRVRWSSHPGKQFLHSRNQDRSLILAVESRFLSCTNSNSVTGPCHGSGGYLPTPHRGGPGSRPVQSEWDLFWTKWHWNRFLSEFFGIPLSTLFPVALHTHISPGGWTIFPLVTAVHRHSLTPLIWHDLNAIEVRSPLHYQAVPSTKFRQNLFSC